MLSFISQNKWTLLGGALLAAFFWKKQQGYMRMTRSGNQMPRKPKKESPISEGAARELTASLGEISHQPIH